MPDSQLKEKLFNMFRSETQEKQTNIDTHRKKKIKINKVKLTARRLKF